MQNTRLIMLEGLPGTGKSTNSFFLRMQLERGGRRVHWVHEIARPHPMLCFYEASLTGAEYASLLKAYPDAAQCLEAAAVRRKNTVGIDLLELEWTYAGEAGTELLQKLKKQDVWQFPLPAYEQTILDKWEHFTESALPEQDTVYILDAGMLQFHIFRFLLRHEGEEKLERFVQKLAGIVEPLCPNLIFFYRENAEETIRFLEKERGVQFLEYILERDRREPYYADKAPAVESVRAFLREYAAMAGRLFDGLPCRKLALEISAQDWPACEEKMLAFLGLERKPGIPAIPPDGVYVSDAPGFAIEIEGLTMKDPGGAVRRLVPQTENTFYVEGLSTVLRFTGDGVLEIADGQLHRRWTTLGLQYRKGEERK